MSDTYVPSKSRIKEKLVSIQQELKAPKGQFNSFGKYRYRSCEDILEAVKPILAEHKVIMTISDDVVMVGDRIYVKAIARLEDAEGDGFIINTAWAREENEKKGMDGSQITGTASSYARKYCLNGLFLIDDTKDADTDEFHKKTHPEEKSAEKKPVTDKQIEKLVEMAQARGKELDIDEIRKNWTYETAEKFIKGGKAS